MGNEDNLVAQIKGEIVTKIDLSVHGDPELVKQVTKLMSNMSVKVTPPPDTQPPEQIEDEGEEEPEEPPATQ